MTEITPATVEISDTGRHVVTRRRLLKQAGAAGIALTAMYVAPSFTSFGPKKAFASITGSVPPCDSELCAGGRKASKLTMEYTGLANAGSNSQDSSKVVVSGDPGGASPVYIEATDKDPTKHHVDSNEKFWFTGPVVVGGTFVIDSANGPDTKLKSRTYVYIYDNSTDLNLLQFIEFHTSCSQDLFLGDGFGTLLLTQFVDEDGVVDCDDSSPDASSTICDSRPAYLTMVYTGDSGDGSNTQTGSKTPVIVGDPAGATTVTIKWVKKDDSGTVFATFSNVDVGDSFVLDHAVDDHGHPHLGSTTRLLICDAITGAVLQDIKFHTSCSAPLNIGDTFGSVELTVFVGEDGAVFP